MLFLCTSKTNTKSTLAPKATLKRSLAHYPNDLMGVKPKYNSVTLFFLIFWWIFWLISPKKYKCFSVCLCINYALKLLYRVLKSS